MGALLLLLLYCASSLLLAWVSRCGGRSLPSRAAFLVLTLIPLAYSGGGFLKDRVVAPTNSLMGIAPWADGSLIQTVEEGSTPANPLLLDPLSEMEPWRQAGRRDLLFNPGQGAGAALLANGQSAVLFPVEAAGRLLPPVRAATYHQAARLLLAVWGMFWLARRFAVGERAAVLAAIAYSGAGFLQVWRGHPHSYVAALLPWIVGAVVLAVRRPGPRTAVGLGVVGAVGVFAGHPETLLHGVFLALLVAAPFLRRRKLRRVVVWGLAGALLSVLLAAPALLPFVENLTVSAEWEKRDGHEANVVEVPLAQSLTRLAPAVAHRALGDPLRETWAGPENLAELGGGSLGAATLVLLAFAWRDRRRRRLVGVLLAIGLAGLLVGAHFPILSKPFGWAPLLGKSLLKRLCLWWVLTAALAAGLAMEGLLRSRRRSPWATGLAALGVLGALLLLVAWAHPTGRLVESWLPELAAGLVAVVGAVLLAGAGRGWAGTALGRATLGRAALGGALLAAALLVPRVELFAGWIPLSSAFSFYPETPAVRWVEERLAPGQRVAGFEAALLPHSAASFGFEDVRAYDPMTFAPYERFAGLLGPKGRVGWQRILDPDPELLRYLGVRFLFDHPIMGARPGLGRPYAEYDAVVYEVADPLPRLFAPERYRVAASAEDSLDRIGEIERFDSLALIAGDDLPESLRADGERGAGERANGAIEITELRHGGRGRRIEVRLRAGEPGIVVSSQPAIPGWKLRVDGRPAPWLRANGAFLAFSVEPGERTVELRYAPTSWRIGLLLAALGAALSGALLPWRPTGGA